MSYQSRSYFQQVSSALFCCLILFCHQLNAQVPVVNYTLSKTLNDQNGLRNNNVTAIYNDTSSGILWIGTQNGLSAFNGYQVLNPNLMVDGINLANQRIASIFRIVDGPVIVAPFLNYLVAIDGNDLIPIRMPDKKAVLYAFRGSMSSISDVVRVINGEMPGQDNWAYSSMIAPAGPNRFLTVTNDGYVCCQSGKQLWKMEVPDVYFRTIYHPDDAFLAWSTPSRTLSEIDTVRKVLKPVMLSEELDKTLRNPNTLLLFDETHKQMFAVSDNRILRLKFANGTLYVSYELRIDRVPQEISQIVQDDVHGKLIISTERRGVYLYNRQVFRNYSLNDREVYSMTVLNDNTLLLRSGETFDLHTGLPSGHIFSEYPGDNGLCAIGNRGNGLFDMSTGSGLWETDSTGKRLATAQGPPRLDCFDLVFYDTVSERLWMSDNLRFMYRDHGNNVEVTTGRPPGRIICMYHEPGKPLVAGTDHSGIYYFEDNSNRWESIPELNGTEVRGMAFIGNWLIAATYGSGIKLINWNTKEVMGLNNDRLNYLAWSHNIIPDRSGNYWVPTNKGLFCFHYEPGDAFHGLPRFDFYNKEDGLPANEFNGGFQPEFTYWRQELLLPTMGGVAAFDPLSMPARINREPVFVDHLEVNGKEMKWPETDLLEFTSDQRNIQFWFNIPFWYNTYAADVSWSLDGGTWTSLDMTHPVISFVYLNSGSHALRLRKYTDAKGPAGFVDQTYHFRIAYTLYERWFFFPLVIGSAMLLLVLIIQARTLRLRRKNRVLLKTIQGQTQEFRTATEEYKTTLKKVSRSDNFRAGLITMLAHDITNPMSTVQALSEILLNDTEDLIDKAKRLKTIGQIHLSSREIKNLSSRLIEWAEVQKYSGELQVQPFPISKLFAELERAMENMLWLNGNQLTTTIEEELVLNTEYISLKHITLNLLINANKYTKQGSIELAVHRSGKDVIISVADNGPGMSESQLNKVNQYQPAGELDSERSGWGLGYRIIFDLLERVNGGIRISNRQTGGLQVEVIVYAAIDADTQINP